MDLNITLQNVLWMRRMAEENAIAVIKSNINLNEDEKCSKITEIRNDYQKYLLNYSVLSVRFLKLRRNERLFESEDMQQTRISDTRKELSARNRQKRKENERFFCNAAKSSAFFNETFEILKKLLPDIHFAASEYVYKNLYGEIFFISLTDFAPNYVIGVINSINRLPEFEYEKLIAKPIPFDDLSRIQIHFDHVKQQIYDTFDLIYHEAEITKASCFNSSLFIRDPSPNKVLKATDYEDNPPSNTSYNDVNMNKYFHSGDSFKLSDFAVKCKISRKKNSKSKALCLETLSKDKHSDAVGNNIKPNSFY